MVDPKVLWSARVAGWERQTYSVAFSPDGRTLAAGSIVTRAGKHMGEVTLWDVPSGRLRRRLDRLGFIVTGVAFSPDGTRLAVAAGYRFLVILDSQSLAIVRSVDPERSGCTDGVYSPVFTPYGKFIAGTGGHIVIVWDMESLRLVRTLQGGGIAFSPSGEIVATSHREPDEVRVWEMRNPEDSPSLLRTFPHPSTVLSMSFSADGSSLACGCDRDPLLRLWKVETGELMTIESDSKGPTLVLFSPRAEVLAAGSNWASTIYIWNTSSGALKHTVRVDDPVVGALWRLLGATASPVYALAFSPDGSKLAAACGGKVKLWQGRVG